MTNSQAIKLWAKSNNIKVCNKHNVVMLSKQFDGGSMWIECFDDYKQAIEYVKSAQMAYIDNNKSLPWSKYNVK